jgi:hypothetical protein
MSLKSALLLLGLASVKSQNLPLSYSVNCIVRDQTYLNRNFRLGTVASVYNVTEPTLWGPRQDLVFYPPDLRRNGTIRLSNSALRSNMSVNVLEMGTQYFQDYYT